MLPTVFHVSARTLAAQALSIFGDHSDVMATRQTGFSMIASSSVQEAMDLGAVAHLSTLKSRIPFVHFFDGSEFSRIQKIEVWIRKPSGYDQRQVSCFIRNRALILTTCNKGYCQNPDVFLQASREACNPYSISADSLPDIWEKSAN